MEGLVFDPQTIDIRHLADYNPVYRWWSVVEAKTWLRLKIYLPAQVLTGHAYYPYHQRLLDLLNGVWPEALESRAEFLPLSEITIQYASGKEDTVATAFVNKGNILLVRLLESNHIGERGKESRHKPYPFVEKTPVAVKLYLLSYTLTAQMHCARGERVWDVLNRGPRFLPLTDVELVPASGSRESGIAFMAVNKGHIISVEETGTPLMGAHSA